MFGFNKDPSSSQKPEKNPGILASLKQRLSKTRSNLSDGIADILLGKKQLDDELFQQLEDQLLMADVGIEATTKIIQQITETLKRKQLNDSDSLYQALTDAMTQILLPCSQPLKVNTDYKPYVILMVGINGAGKTTTTGKLAQKYQQMGLNVMLAAGDTFRAAAVEQLKTWGQRLNIPVISQGSGAEPASVIYDALQSARAKNIDILIADTAGRLHTQNNLMDELAKIKRVLRKLDVNAPHETMLVLDSGTGQNALSQAKSFNDTIGISGLTLTKLDGTAKGGIIFTLAEKLKLPIRFIGVGESVEDLREFDSDEFVFALLDREQ